MGGRLADHRLKLAVLGTMASLAVVLLAMTAGIHNPVAAVGLVGLLGIAGFATVAPLQSWVLSKAQGAGESLASSLNIAAFNLGNALGAWAGGLVIEHGPGLPSLPLASAVFPVAAILIAVIAMRADGQAAAMRQAAE